MKLSDVNRILKLFTILFFALKVDAQASVLTNLKLIDSKKFITTDFQYAGSGCPDKSIQIFKEGEEFVLEHTEFFDSLNDGNLSRKSCMVRIPVKVDKGYQVALNAQTIGHGVVDNGSMLTFKRELFVSGQEALVQLTKMTNEDFSGIVLEEINPDQLEFTECGRPGILAMNLSGLLRSNESFKNLGQYNVDATILRIVVRKCK